MKYYRLLKRSSFRNFFFFFFFSGIGFSNLSAQKNFRSGGVAGINGSQLSGDTYSGFNQPGFYAGFFTQWQQTEKITFQFDIAYSQRGSRHIPRPEKGDFTEYVLRLNYVDVPVFLKYSFTGFTLDLGLCNSWLLNYYENNQNGPVYPVRPFNRYELGGIVGAGYELNEHFFLSLRIHNSIIPVREHQSGTSWKWNLGQYSSALTFAVYYRL